MRPLAAIGRRQLTIATLVGEQLSPSVSAASRGCCVVASGSVSHFERALRAHDVGLAIYEAAFGGPTHPAIREILSAASFPVLVVVRGTGNGCHELVEFARTGGDHIIYAAGIDSHLEAVVRQLIESGSELSAVPQLLHEILKESPVGLMPFLLNLAVLAQGPATVQLLSVTCGVSQRTLERRFSTHRLRLQRCLMAARIAVALYRLIAVGWTVGRVLEAGGFRDASGVSRGIRRYSGRTLTQWREECGHDHALSACMRGFRKGVRNHLERQSGRGVEPQA